MFVRFVTAEVHKDSQSQLGVFQAAFRLRDKDELYDYEEVLLPEVLDWFNKHLEKPDKFTSSKPPYYRKKSKAISWFKGSAKDHLAMMRQIVSILENHDVPTRMIKTARPGYIVYEDEYQVAAEPFADRKL